jgi:hypothetical protein
MMLLKVRLRHKARLEVPRAHLLRRDRAKPIAVGLAAGARLQEARDLRADPAEEVGLAVVVRAPDPGALAAAAAVVVSTSQLQPGCSPL